MALVTPDQLASRIGMVVPLPVPVELRLRDAIEDAEAKVQLYLNRTSLEAVEHTVVGLVPDERWVMDDPRAWPQAKSRFQDRFRVVSWVVNADDPTLFDVTFAVGLDVANDPELRPILSFIKQDAVASAAADPTFAGVARTVQSVSADGQSVTYATGGGGGAEGVAGGSLSLSSLKRWRRLSIYQAPGVRRSPWPYSSP